jgi:hypothetical protein
VYRHPDVASRESRRRQLKPHAHRNRYTQQRPGRSDVQAKSSTFPSTVGFRCAKTSPRNFSCCLYSLPFHDCTTSELLWIGSARPCLENLHQSAKTHPHSRSPTNRIGGAAKGDLASWLGLPGECHGCRLVLVAGMHCPGNLPQVSFPEPPSSRYECKRQAISQGRLEASPCISRRCAFG